MPHVDNPAVLEHAIAATTHGRYLVRPSTAPAAPLLVGFHGYAEPAETQLARLTAIAGSDRWTVVAIQGLHRFYQRRTDEVIASWMTRQDREHAMRDNAAYVADVVAAVARAHGSSTGVVFAGFSQGVAMAFRASVASTGKVLGVVAVGGDVPPEIENASLARVKSALVCRGARDEWYTTAKYQQDLRRLDDSGVAVRAIEFDGGHEWNDVVLREAATFLAERLG
jgi:predicted esterase